MFSYGVQGSGERSPSSFRIITSRSGMGTCPQRASFSKADTTGRGERLGQWFRRKTFPYTMQLKQFSSTWKETKSQSGAMQLNLSCHIHGKACQRFGLRRKYQREHSEGLIKLLKTIRPTYYVPMKKATTSTHARNISQDFVVAILCQQSWVGICHWKMRKLACSFYGWWNTIYCNKQQGRWPPKEIDRSL